MKRITIFLVVLAYYTICYSQSFREDSLKIALSYFDSGQYEKAAVSFFQLGQYKKAIKCLEIYSIETKFEPDEVLVEKYRKCNELLDGGQRAKSLDEKWINYLQLEELNPDDPTVIAEKKKAEKGNGDDLYSIGRYYENVKKDNGQAIIWYKKAIDRGNEKAKGKLLKMEPQSSDSGSMCSNTDSTGKLSTQLHLETNNASGHSDDGRNTKSVFDPSRCDNYVQKTIGYKYSKDFPFAISSIYSFEDLFDHFVYGGFEVGVNLDNKGYVRYALDMKSGDKI